jgi:hypothetical protein
MGNKPNKDLGLNTSLKFLGAQWSWKCQETPFQNKRQITEVCISHHYKDGRVLFVFCLHSGNVALIHLPIPREAWTELLYCLEKEGDLH